MYRLLIVEDDSDILRLYQFLLSDEFPEATIESADSAEKALRLLDNFTYDLLLMDINLPGLDGDMATSWLRSNLTFDCMPIIAVTGHADGNKRRELEKVGFNAIIDKPIDAEIFISTIRKHLGES